jgi:ABC-type phosphate transport system ATPase subunit
VVTDARSAVMTASAPLYMAERAEVEVVDETFPRGRGMFELTAVSVAYGPDTVVEGVTMSIPSQSVTALIGPSGCGKSTLLRCLNRMNDELGNVRVSGTIALDGEREIEFDPSNRISVELDLHGPLTIDVAAVLENAARRRVLRH